MILVNFDIDELIGRRAKVCSTLIRYLICENQLSIDNFNLKAIELMKFHNIKERLDNIELS